eukprot:CAMPEP_0171652904 /NCGR_PEP_ID=MMETSP0990-20121206/39232_2 /TAXON_ID=483369 /ORGANISM="non described non described, Strain CCMP2098" /LENGTH=66 /DNA_ID=CAMNT_0012232213 /DNA_START=373 /DNA_END=571 /DNA_ORIENTATION=-
MAASRVQFVRLSIPTLTTLVALTPRATPTTAPPAEGEHDPHAGADDPEPHEVQGGHELLPPHSPQG